MTNKQLLLVLACFLALTLTGCGIMQDKTVNTTEKYPAKPITIIVPFSAGGSLDMMARAMEKESAKHLGQPLIVTNKPGGGGVIGWNDAVGAKPDGYTISIITIGIDLQPLYGSTKYHYPTALEPLAQVATSPIVVAVSAEHPWKSLNDVIQYAKMHPGELKYGHPGLGSATHVAGEMFVKAAGINIEQVPFRGGSEALASLLGGHVNLIFANPVEVKEYVKSGKLKVLAVAEERRLASPEFRDVPTFKECGLDVVFNIWQGVGAPKGMPDNVKKGLAKGLHGIINDPSFKKNAENLGINIEYLGPEEFGAKWVSESERLSTIINETGIAERIASQKK